MRSLFIRLALASAVVLGFGAGPATAFEATLVLVESDLGSGSGFLVKSDGTLATCARLTASAQWIRIRLANGEQFQRVFVLSADISRDLALLRVEGFELPVLALGNSSDLKPDDPVRLAGFRHEKPAPTVTARLRSQGVDPASGVRLLALDTAVPKGFQGGPLLNGQGEAIGILTSALRAKDGAGAAIPVNSLRAMLDGLPVALAANPPRLVNPAPESSGAALTAVIGPAAPAPSATPSSSSPQAKTPPSPPPAPSPAPAPLDGYLLSGYGDSPDAMAAAYRHLRILLEDRGRPVASTLGQAKNAMRPKVELPELLEKLRQGGGRGLFFYDIRLPVSTGQTCRLKVRFFDEKGREVWEVHTNIAAAATIEEGIKYLINRLEPKLSEKL